MTEKMANAYCRAWDGTLAQWAIPEKDCDSIPKIEHIIECVRTEADSLMGKPVRPRTVLISIPCGPAPVSVVPLDQPPPERA